MAAKLIAEEGILKGLVLSMEGGNQWIIGRDPDACQLLVEDPSASRRHLICRTTPQGIVIENLSSTNPIHVNEEEVKEPRLLHHGDTVTIGTGTFRFYNDIAAHVDHIPTNANPTKEQGEENMQERHDTIFDENDSQEEKVTLAEINLDLMDVSPWLLKVVSGPNSGAEFSMQPETSYVIGTDPATCDIVFNDVSVSRQHARLSIGKESQLMIEDLKSRNGVAIEGKTIQGKQPLSPNTLVSVGTTTFIVYDREGERQTIISPLLPAIVKVLQQEEEKKLEENKKTKIAQETEKEETKTPPVLSPSVEVTSDVQKKERSLFSFGTLIFITIISGVFIVVGMGTAMLFKGEQIESPRIDVNQELANVLAPYPNVQQSFNKTTGRLLLVGHVLTAVDRNELLYNLQTLPFVRMVDDNIIIDEYIWQETNQVLSKNPNWKGVSIHAPTAGHFVITGYLQTRKQSEQLFDYLSQNFAYLDLLEKRIVVEEDVVTQVNAYLQDSGLHDIVVKMNNGEVALSGNILSNQHQELDRLFDTVKAIPGVRSVKNLVTELPTEEAVLNITQSYPVTGSSTQKNGNINVVIRGKFLSKNDVLDGMIIKDIQPNAIYLEKDQVKYRIDYNR